MKKVLVTGAGGFIGSHLVKALRGLGVEIRVLLRYTSHSSTGGLGKAVGLDVRYGDIRDPDCVVDAMNGCDTVFHLAALIGIPYSYVAPREYLDVNARGTLNILEAVRACRCRLVHTSTSEVYGSALFAPMTEAHPKQAQSPYAASKIAADAMVESYVRAFGINAMALRPFNTYGPGQSTRAVIPSIILQAKAGRKVVLGNGSTVRDFTYVDDTVAGFIAAGESDYTGVVHLGTGVGITIRALASKIIAHIGTDPVIETGDRERMRPEASEVTELVSDPSAALDILGWRAKVSIKDGIAKTAEGISAEIDGSFRL